MKLSTSCAALSFFTLNVFALSTPQARPEPCSSILCICDFTSSNSECETKLCTPLNPQTTISTILCPDDFLNTNIELCCTSSDPTACLSALQETSSVCSAGKKSSEVPEGWQQALETNSEHADKELRKRDYSYDSYSTGDSYDEDQSGCAWNFDGASTAGACGDYGGSSYDTGSSYGGSDPIISAAEKTRVVLWTMLVAVAAGFSVM